MAFDSGHARQHSFRRRDQVPSGLSGLRHEGLRHACGFARTWACGLARMRAMNSMYTHTNGHRTRNRGRMLPQHSQRVVQRPVLSPYHPHQRADPRSVLVDWTAPALFHSMDPPLHGGAKRREPLRIAVRLPRLCRPPPALSRQSQHILRPCVAIAAGTNLFNVAGNYLLIHTAGTLTLPSTHPSRQPHQCVAIQLARKDLSRAASLMRHLPCGHLPCGIPLAASRLRHHRNSLAVILLRHPSR
jgi:hypothetical protein